LSFTLNYFSEHLSFARYSLEFGIFSFNLKKEKNKKNNSFYIIKEGFLFYRFIFYCSLCGAIASFVVTRAMQTLATYY
jgi:hypothetical protein